MFLVSLTAFVQNGTRVSRDGAGGDDAQSARRSTRHQVRQSTADAPVGSETQRGEAMKVNVQLMMSNTSPPPSTKVVKRNVVLLTRWPGVKLWKSCKLNRMKKKPTFLPGKKKKK